jgi:outer membrane protein assembly factor BamB
VLAGLGAVPAVALFPWPGAAVAIVTDGGWLVVLDASGEVVKRSEFCYRADWGPVLLGEKLALLPTPDAELIGLDTASFASSKQQFGGLDLDRVAIDVQQAQVVVCDDQSLKCCDASLNILWEQQALDGRFSSPCIGPEGVIVVASGLDRLYAFDSSGNELWNADVDGMLWGKPILDAQTNTYVFTREAGIVSFNKKGRRRWTYQSPSRVVGINLSPSGQLIVCTQGSIVSLGK